MENKNSVTVFTRGVAHFRKVVKLDTDVKKLNIPFRKDVMDEVLATLDVFGPVKYKVPPSYTPEGLNENGLKLNKSGEVLEQLINQLSGASVEVKSKDGSSFSGTLVGLDKQTMKDGVNSYVLDRNVVVYTQTALRKLRLDDVDNLSFSDEEVQREVDEALSYNLQNIKPDSTFIELELERTSNKVSEAVVEYVVPLAAWKMRYSFRQLGKECKLIGSAVIDNNTDEDWLDVYVNIVTGDPITFRTDLNEVRVPKRDFVKLIDDRALGNVHVESGRTIHRHARTATAMGGGLEFQAAGAMNIEEEGMVMQCSALAPSADFVDVEAVDVGDFQVFSTKEPLTIKANKSAIVPMFTADIRSDNTLLYKEQNHATRPYRSLAFTNNTGFSLGKGKAVVNDSGLFAGEAVLETTKPGEEQVLPYCLENGVKVFKELGKTKDWQSYLKISDGLVLTKHVHTQEMIYSFKNLKDEMFDVNLEHASIWNDSEYTYRLDGEEYDPGKVERLSHGIRVNLSLPSNSSLNFVVKERHVNESRVRLGNIQNLRTHLKVNADLFENEQVKRCLFLQEELDKASEAISKLDKRVSSLTDRCDLLRMNLEAVKNISENQKQVVDWVNELKDSTDEITSIEDDQKPTVHKNIEELNDSLREELKKLELEKSF